MTSPGRTTLGESGAAELAARGQGCEIALERGIGDGGADPSRCVGVRPEVGERGLDGRDRRRRVQ
ncbi:hypothetical protein [Salana multivorans]